jgi:hypothetical protein
MFQTKVVANIIARTYLLTLLLTYFVTYLLSYFTEQSSSLEANRFIASQEIHRVLLNVKVHYCIHKSILSQPNSVHTPTSHFLKIHPNIILPSTPGSPQWSLFPQVSPPNPIHACLLPHLRYMPRPSHSRFYSPHDIGWGVQIMKLLIMKFSPLPLLPRPS